VCISFRFQSAKLGRLCVCPRFMPPRQAALFCNNNFIPDHAPMRMVVSNGEPGSLPTRPRGRVPTASRQDCSAFLLRHQKNKAQRMNPHTVVGHKGFWGQCHKMTAQNPARTEACHTCAASARKSLQPVVSFVHNGHDNDNTFCRNRILICSPMCVRDRHQR
jgi:hypothetical protein